VLGDPPKTKADVGPPAEPTNDLAVFILRSVLQEVNKFGIRYLATLSVVLYHSCPSIGLSGLVV